MCPASQACRSVLKQLLDQDWASKVFSNLEQLLSPEPQAARLEAAAGPVHAVRLRAASTLQPAFASADTLLAVYEHSSSSDSISCQ